MGRLSKVLVFVVVLAVAAAGVAVASNRIGDNTTNTLTGTENPDAIYGLGKADTLNGLGGNDEISGNAGADRINGGAGNDVMVGGPGVDRINAGDNTVDANSTDFFYSFDGNAETVCIGNGDNWNSYIDITDTVVGPPSCSTPIYTPPTTLASSDGTGRALTLSSADH